MDADLIDMAFSKKRGLLRLGRGSRKGGIGRIIRRPCVVRDLRLSYLLFYQGGGVRRCGNALDRKWMGGL